MSACWRSSTHSPRWRRRRRRPPSIGPTPPCSTPPLSVGSGLPRPAGRGGRSATLCNGRAGCRAIMADRQFWRASGYDLLGRRDDGRLAITADFVRAYLGRPEMMPPPEACAAEQALHASLLADPGRAVTPGDIAGLAEPDARENHAVFLRFRDLLFGAGTAEAAYLGLFRPRAPALPALFIDQLAAVILRHVLDGCDDPLRARAAELFFRTQKAALETGAVLLADDETVDALGRDGGLGELGRLVAPAGTAVGGGEVGGVKGEDGRGQLGGCGRPGQE